MEKRIWKVLKAVLPAGTLVLSSLLLLGCGNEVDLAQGNAPTKETRRPPTSGALAPGDVISVVYPGAPELNLQQKIRADGRVSLPKVGDLRAGGKTPTSFQSELHRRYRAVLQDPKVVVSVVSAAAAVYVWGEVTKPGKVPLDRPMNALEAIMEAGGFTGAADLRKVSVVRTVNGTHKRYNLNMNAALTRESAAFYVRPYDVIRVGQRVW